MSSFQDDLRPRLHTLLTSIFIYHTYNLILIYIDLPDLDSYRVDRVNADVLADGCCFLIRKLGLVAHPKAAT